MPPAVDVNFQNVSDNCTISTPTSPPFFQVEVYWNNPLNKDGTVTLTGSNGVTITPASRPATMFDQGTALFSLSASSTVSGVSLTAKIEVPTNPKAQKSATVTGVTVNVT